MADEDGIGGAGGRHDQPTLFGGLNRLRVGQCRQELIVDGFGDGNQIDNFLKICRREIPADATAEQGLEMARILTAIYESARLGSEVTITR